MAEKVENVKKVSRAIESFKRAMERHYPKGAPPDKEYFDALMRQEVKAGRPEEVRINLPEERGSRSVYDDLTVNESEGKKGRRLFTENYTSRDLITEAKNAVAQIDDLKQKLSTPELRIKSSVQHLLKNKLSNINENLRTAFGRAGVDYIPPDQQRAIGNPVTRFLDLLSHGQSQLQSLSGHVEGLAAKGKELSPADLLALQLKVSHVQQELEFFTALLNKTLESTKTLMNVQV